MTPEERVIALGLEPSLSHVYDPVKRKEYYERTKKLKGRKRKSSVPSRDSKSIASDMDKVRSDQKRISKQFDRVDAASKKTRNPIARYKLHSAKSKLLKASDKNTRKNLALRKELEAARERESARKPKGKRELMSRKLDSLESKVKNKLKTNKSTKVIYDDGAGNSHTVVKTKRPFLPDTTLRTKTTVRRIR